jgi:carbamoyltransferase|tara:strand:+ start:1796 stop:2347 length:552 start_codon:yes stop_codon:yes gene_type:complete
MKTIKCSIVDIVSKLISNEIGAIFQGKLELGPRALGNRSIIADPRMEDGKDRVNEVKNREWYRPFACSILEEHAHEWFEMGRLKSSPFMSYAVPVKEEKRKQIPAVIHVDGTCRLQTVNEKQNPIYYNLIKEFYKQTNIPLILNTSFNLAGQPIVFNPAKAIDIFLSSKLRFIWFPEIEKAVV